MLMMRIQVMKRVIFLCEGEKKEVKRKKRAIKKMCGICLMIDRDPGDYTGLYLLQAAHTGEGNPSLSSSSTCLIPPSFHQPCSLVTTVLHKQVQPP